MSTFHVYAHPRGDYEAIPDGFSIPGLMLGGAWALSKRLWKTGLLLLAADALAVAAMRAGGQSGAVTWMLGGLVVIMVAHGLAGVYGAYWHENSMGARGYTFVATVTADSIEAAVKRAMREERTPSADERDTSSTARRAAIAPEPLTPGMTGTRFEIDFDRLRDPMGAEGAAAGEPADDGTPGEDAAERPAPEAGPYRALDDDDRAQVEDEPPRRRFALVVGLVGLLVVGALAAGAWFYLGGRSHSTDQRRAASDTADAGASSARAPAKAAAPQPQPVPTPVPIPVPTPVAASASDGAGAATPAAAPDGAAQPSTRHARPLSPAEIEAAWARHYKPAAKCIEPADWDTYVECVNTMMREREAFAARLTNSAAVPEAPPAEGP